MWPFVKRYPDLEKVHSVAEEWTVATAEYDGSTLILRKNVGCRDWVGHPGLSIKLAFAIPLNKPQPGALPDPEENAQLGPIEEQIAETVASALPSIFAVVLTTGVMKELVFYVADGAKIKDLHQRLQTGVASHEVQCIAEVEKKWDTYKGF